jgi:hypothetical protein
VRDFTLPRQNGSALPLLDDAQSDAVGSKTSRAYKRISNEAVHMSSALLGMLLGLLGAWFVAWLSA